MSAKEVLISGKSSFKIEVPYKLIETGPKGEKPLIVYLHGYKQNIKKFEALVEGMMELNAYHLFIQGPYPIYDESRKVSVSKWGRSWYLYDGKRGQFAKSLEVTSEFIQEIVEGLFNVIKVNKVCLFGYSMGGYQAGYFALSRWKHVSESIIIGARIKTELFEDKLELAKHIKFLALHGKDDTDVYPEPQQKEIEKLKEEGFVADFVQLNEGHKLTKPFVEASKSWLIKQGY
tara:strand:- start:7430 stop:8125 length:696 start_codon:yes stop_codon:yes gene_type:complete